MEVTTDPATDNSKDADWITTRVSAALASNTSVTKAASVRVEALLRSQLSERQLTSKELAGLATSLITDMTPTPPTSEEMK